MKKFENLSLEKKEAIVEQINAEVTSIAQEEARTGQTIPVPQGEQLVTSMSMELMRCRKEISTLLPTMSKKSIHRSTMAYLDLPTDGVPVYLKTDEEKKLFAYGQRAIMARMVIIQHHVNKLALEAKANQQAKESEIQDGPV